MKNSARFSLFLVLTSAGVLCLFMWRHYRAPQPVTLQPLENVSREEAGSDNADLSTIPTDPKSNEEANASNSLDFSRTPLIFEGTPLTNTSLNANLFAHPTEESSEKAVSNAASLPAGATMINMAFNCMAISSDNRPINGSPELITNGKIENTEEEIFRMHRGLQWIQVDLGQPCSIFYIKIWHTVMEQCFCHDVVVQISENQEFKEGVVTVFNNDSDNSSGLGTGRDNEYYETMEGLTINFPETKARYVRAYSRGSNLSQLNRFSEIGVYGLPAFRKP